MLEVAICDDDKEDLDKAALMLDKILSEYQVQYQIRSFLSANELLNNNDKIDIGICLLYTSHASVSSISGLGIVLSNFIPLPLSAITMILNVVLLVIGFFTCGRAVSYTHLDVYKRQR